MCGIYFWIGIREPEGLDLLEKMMQRLQIKDPAQMFTKGFRDRYSRLIYGRTTT